jgi:hypothetical protein
MRATAIAAIARVIAKAPCGLLIGDLPSTAKILRPTKGDFNKLITDHGQGP